MLPNTSEWYYMCKYAARSGLRLFGWFYWISIDSGCRRQISMHTLLLLLLNWYLVLWIEQQKKIRDEGKNTTNGIFPFWTRFSFVSGCWNSDVIQSTMGNYITSIGDDYKRILIFLRKQFAIVKCLSEKLIIVIRANVGIRFQRSSIHLLK